MSRFCKNIRKLFYMMDLFSTNELLRFKGEPYYATLTGGCTSLAVIAIFMGLFFSMGLQTLRKEIITSSVSVQYEQDPVTINFKQNQDSSFIFAFTIPGLNLNDASVTYFDFHLYQVFMSPGLVVINSTQIPLQQCTSDRFSQLPNGQQMFTAFQGSNWKCVSSSSDLTVGGKVTSDVFSSLELVVSKCNTTTHSNCIPDASLSVIETQLGGYFTLATPIINTVINPNDENHVVYNVEERNAFYFTRTLGFKSIAYISEHEVKTDESLMPWQQIKTQKFINVPEVFQTQTVSVTNDVYANIGFQKAAVTTSYTRSFNKLDNYFSYVGGLIGTILAFVFVLTVYSQKAYGISLAHQLFTNDDGSSIADGDFHMGYLVTVGISKVLQFFGCRPRWQKTNLYDDCIEEMDEQLNVPYLLKKVFYLEKAIELLLKEHQLQALQLQSKYSLGAVQKRRSKHQFLSNLKKKTPLSQNIDKRKVSPEITMSIEGEFTSAVYKSKSQSREPSGEIMNDEVSSGSLDEKSEIDTSELKNNLIRLLRQAQKGDQVSKKIAKQISPKTLQRIGISAQLIDASASEQLAVSQKQNRNGRRIKSHKITDNLVVDIDTLSSN